MRSWRIPIEGNAALAAGRLALVGVQSRNHFPTNRAAAILKAESAEAALDRVSSALGEGFEVGEPRAEPDAEGSRWADHHC